MKDVQHVIWVALILAVSAAVALIVRAQLIPETFGLYGRYRGASVQEIMDTPVKYVGVETCKSAGCHEEEWKEWRESVHKNVACENCHGPGVEHSRPDADPENRPKIFGTKDLMAKSHDLCLSCHAKTPGRPDTFPQVEFAEHIVRYDISKTDAGEEAGDSTVPAQEDRSGQAPSEEIPPAAGDVAVKPLPEEYSCMFCHGPEGTLADDEETKNMIITEEDLAADVHWQKGLQCHDCHGGSPTLDEFEDHRNDDSFRPLASPSEIPEFCGHCHSNMEYMSKYDPSARADQVTKYWDSSHGLRLKSQPDDAGVATCVSCHGHHEIRAVDDPQSAAHSTKVSQTCGSCHFDVESMGPYQRSPLAGSHGQRVESNGDAKDATCVSCHGYHTVRAIAELGTPYHCVACHNGHSPARGKEDLLSPPEDN